MTIRKNTNQNKEIGQLLKGLRLALNDIDKTRQAFIDDRSEKFFDNSDWISEKTLQNYENGKNIPTIPNLLKLAVALEIDERELLIKIKKRL
ncbi:helix-turn-helix transcriptional regulator [Enterococcus faecalis]|uniref:helix-turn-helix domain-containing protein n=1 Tax=Enterococcus faecalis TaxID=1351 RepID=UPI003DA1C927